MKIKRRANGSWVARWIDPLTGRETQQSLDALGLTTAEARRRWAIDKAASLKDVATAVTSGRAVATRVELRQAIQNYLQASTARPSTLASYEPPLAKFADWAESGGVRFTQDLQPRHLAAFRDYVVKLPASVAAAATARGRKQASGRLRAGVTVNREMAVAKIFLNWARRAGLTPHVDGDSIRDRLRPVKVERDAVEFLRPPQVRQLLAAVLRHDGATFSMTRAEHGGLQPAGSTPRYEPAAPFVLLALLLGTRLQELVGLEWDEVDLQAGEIRLPAKRVKTGAARTITLQETPAALELLRALRVRTPGDRVFPGWSNDLAKAVRLRLTREFKAPRFNWQMLRRTCAATLTNAPSVFGAASAYRSARRSGHSVAVAERHYVDLLRDLPVTAKTLEAAVGIEKLARQIVAGVGAEVERQVRAE